MRFSHSCFFFFFFFSDVDPRGHFESTTLYPKLYIENKLSMNKMSMDAS